jgi:acetoin utilization deacetylase AcuC-like enzyme
MNDVSHTKHQTVALMYSQEYVQLLHATMEHIHKDRDLLLSSLLYSCGFLRDTPKFFKVIKPKFAKRQNLERFHSKDYLDLLEFPKGSSSDAYQNSDTRLHRHNADFLALLDSYGLTDDCSIPIKYQEREMLWRYCCAVAGASIHGTKLLLSGELDVSINWGGGRHHAHCDKAGGFCYINDVVLSIQEMLRFQKRVMYFDIDIHHADGVQQAFYDTDQVLTISLHRHVVGFFPSSTGSIKERGKHNSQGVGYNLNLPLPRDLQDADMIKICDSVINDIATVYDPDVVVLCVGADGLRGDRLVKETCEGWSLTPECLAEIVRRVSSFCGGRYEESSSRKRKLLILGGGGYEPAPTAKAWLLSTAAACEGIRRGMVWKELPKDIPRHEYFDRYGPSFELVGNLKGNSKYSPLLNNDSRIKNHDYDKIINEAIEALELSKLFLVKQNRDREVSEVSFQVYDDDVDWTLDLKPNTNTFSRKKSRRRKI